MPAMSKEPASVTEWVRQLAAGDQGGPAEMLWERYFQRLVELARNKLRDAPRRVADEEDVALSAFDSFCEGAVQGRFPQLDDRDSLWRLLVTITARKAYRLQLMDRRQKRGGGAVVDQAALAARAAQGKARAGRANDDAAVVGLDQFIAREPTPEFAAQTVEEYRHLLALLGDDRLREVAQWKMEGYTNKEIAAKLRCVPRTVERYLVLIRSVWRTTLAS